MATATSADVPAYEAANIASAERLRRYNPVNPFALPQQLELQSRGHRTFLVHAKHPIGDHDLVGKVNVVNVIRGRGLMATIGYDAYDPYAGKGLFREGLAAVLSLVFAPEPEGMGLHRVEANVQPRNVRSAAVVRSLGFVHEGFARSYLYLPDAAGDERWRDHDRYALRSEDHPAAPYRIEAPRRVVAIVNGMPGSGKTTLARALSMRLGIPLFSRDTVMEAVADALGPSVYDHGPDGPLGAGASMACWAMLKASPAGGIVESWFPPETARYVRRGLSEARLAPEDVPEVWCDLPVDLARARYEDRAYDGTRHAVHGASAGQDALWETLRNRRKPLGLGPVLRVDTTEAVTQATLTDLCLQVRAWSS